MHIKKELLVFTGIFLLGLILRIYRMDSLAVFLADQASDSNQVFNIVNGDFTLLGPITSVGGFYNGPIVYYLMTPFYWLFQGSPLSGTIFQTVLSVSTIPLLYLLGKRIKNEYVGLIAAFLFAISPLMIDYARAGFNAHPATFFSTLIVYLLITLHDRYSLLRYIFLGICIGWIIQMHYFTIVFVFLSLTVPWISEKKIPVLSYYSLLSLGVLLGMSPFILFEIRHDFINTTLFLEYLSKTSGGDRNLWEGFMIWPKVMGNLLYGNNFILGIIGIVFLFLGLFVIYRSDKKVMKKLRPFLLLFGFVFIVGLAYGKTLQFHYVISVHTTLLLLYAVILYEVFKNNIKMYIGIAVILLLLNAKAWNLHLEKHPGQDGLNIADFHYTAEIIHADTKGKYNVGMHAQGDNRAMPLRYMLRLKKDFPETYENYSDLETLYFLVKKTEKITDQKMWEYTVFGKSKVEKKWEINNDYFLYKLKKS